MNFKRMVKEAKEDGINLSKFRLEAKWKTILKFHKKVTDILIVVNKDPTEQNIFKLCSAVERLCEKVDNFEGYYSGN